MCIMFYNETIVASPLSRDPADDQIVEGRGRIRLGPQTDPPRAEARVAVVEQQCSVEPALYVVADGDHMGGAFTGALASCRRPRS